ncbi:MAG: acireductone dioxygenase [Gammaproteobacteria bacterium]|nr:acireductone dioxygenase [Gammaproteobacteria bacterium]
MSILRIYDEQARELERHSRGEDIAPRLREIGVAFERWEASRPLTASATQEEVLAAYRTQVDRLNAAYGFTSVDVVSLRPDHPDRAAMRGKFLNEHTHDDFEVRFFVEGKGIFYLHATDRVHAILCERGDLISVPADTRHWFDMGTAPDFKCIRFFTKPEGWVGNFTGSDIAQRFPTFDNLVRAAA